jgi:hypothetical protein
LQHIIEGVEPFAGFGGVEVGRVLGGNVSHGLRFLSKLSANSDLGCRPNHQL